MAAVEQSLSFKIKTILLNNDDGSSIDVSKNVKNIMIKKDYINNVFPLFVINMTLTELERDMIRDNNTDISLSIYSGNDMVKASDDDDSHLSNSVLNTVIRIYDKQFTTDSASSDENEDDTDESTGTENAPNIFYSVSGVPKDIIDSNKGHINSIYDNCKVATAALNIVSDMSIQKNIYFDSADLSSESYKYILIPPQTPISALSYLDDNYKLYNYGALNVFYDTNNIYLYNMNNPNRVFNKMVLYKELDNQSTNNAKRRIEFDDDNQRLICYTDSTPTFIDTSKISNYDVGTTRTFYSYDDVFDIVSRNGGKQDDDFSMNRYFWNPGRKQLFEDSFGSLTSTDSLIPLVLGNVDMDFFAPDTIVMIESKYDKISGSYIVGSVSSMLSNVGEDVFNSTVSLGLIKTK